MARIVSFSVENLAGREGPYSRELNRDVNVFYGVNGSGKTTLLKILHSALLADTSILAGLPFKSAEVVVHLNRYDRVFKRTYENKELDKTQEAEPSRYSLSASILGGMEERPKWTSEPEEPGGGLTPYRGEGYLPITRLYRSVARTGKGANTISEEELDARFAEAVQRHWKDYCAETSKEITEAQEKGLATILHLVLSGGEAEGKPENDSISSDEAYTRVVAFLSRQPGFQDVLDSPDEFAKKYRKKPQIRSIVREIDRVEKRIEWATAPRSRLKQLLESLYSGNKRIVLTDKEISVEVSSERKIKLPALSSGEKQLFFISLAALRSGDHAMMIDEPELSMHVDWQKKLVASLRELNPLMQLIMATHSPEIMADLPDNEVFSL